MSKTSIAVLPFYTSMKAYTKFVTAGGVDKKEKDWGLLVSSFVYNVCKNPISFSAIRS